MLKAVTVMFFELFSLCQLVKINEHFPVTHAFIIQHQHAAGQGKHFILVFLLLTLN